MSGFFGCDRVDIKVPLEVMKDIGISKDIVFCGCLEGLLNLPDLVQGGQLKNALHMGFPVMPFDG